MKKINILIVALFFVLTITLFGQDISSGRIYSAKGNDFVILRDGKRILYDANRLSEGPIAFLQGDIFQTGQQSSADIQFGANGPLLKIVENSQIGLVSNGSNQSPLGLNLFYGRIRVRTIDGGPSAQVASDNGLVEVKRGDVGIDYIVRNDLVTLQSEASVSSPVLYVTNFAGETNVFPENDGNAVSALPQLLVRQGETVSVEFVSSVSYVERNALGSATTDYWRANDFAPPPVFAGTTAASNSNMGIISPTVTSSTAASSPSGSSVSSNVQEIPYSLPPVNPVNEAQLKRKNNAFLAGLIFLAGGIALEGIGMYHQAEGNADAGYFYSISGMVVSGVGAAALIHGLTIKLE